MSAFYSGRGRERGPERPPTDGRTGDEPRPEVVLEHFDFEHPVFREDTWSEVESSYEPLPESVSVWVDQLRSLVARQVGTKEVLGALGDTMLDRERDADRYVDDRLAAGESREQIRTDVQAAHDALEARIHGITFPDTSNKTLDKGKN
jgi:hypothetical protein